MAMPATLFDLDLQHEAAFRSDLWSRPRRFPDVGAVALWIKNGDVHAQGQVIIRSSAAATSTASPWPRAVFGAGRPDPVSSPV